MSHGIARYEAPYLTVTVPRKQGKRTVDLTVVYLVEDASPDRKVAYPAFSLKRGVWRSMVTQILDEKGRAIKSTAEAFFHPTGEVYHVACIKPWSATCDCFQGLLGRQCKHLRSLRVTGLLERPKGGG